jgi:hypothetical protein
MRPRGSWDRSDPTTSPAPRPRGLAAYGLAVGLAFVAPLAALAIHAVSAGYYAFDQASMRLVATTR